VRYTDLRGSLGRLSDKGKTMVFLDASHSGNVIPGTRAGDSADLYRIAADLASAETGVIVFSSSTGRQFSMESAAFGHGTSPGAAGGVRRQVRPPAALAPGRGPADLARPTRQGTQQRRAEPDDAITVQGFTNWTVYQVATSAK
jgi:uncharacterized caspase-like protein